MLNADLFNNLKQAHAVTAPERTENHYGPLQDRLSSFSRDLYRYVMKFWATIQQTQAIFRKQRQKLDM